MPCKSQIIALILPTITAACGGGVDSSATRVATDSAGIDIVTIRPGEDVSATIAPLDATPQLEVGVIEGPEEMQLFEVTGGIRLSDGRIVVGNGGTRELRFYEPDGAFSGTAGREGEGPGEFRRIDFLGRLAGDTMAVYDSRLRRLSRFDDAGTYLDSHRLAGAALPYVVGVIGPTTFVAWQFTGADDDRLGVYAASVEFGMVDLSGGEFRPVDTVAGSEEARVVYRGDVTRAFRPFGRETDIAAGGDYVYVLTSSDDRSIRVYDATGTLIRVLRVAIPREPADAAAVETWVESWMASFSSGSPDIEAWWRHGFRETPPPEHIPLFRALQVDEAGNVCAERYPIDWEAGAEYWCFSPDGHLLRRFRLPPGLLRRGPHPYFDPQLEIGAGEVIGVWQDELDVQYVRVYAFE